MRRSPFNGFGRGGPVAPTGLPAWLGSTPVNAWVEIAGSAMSNFPPSVAAPSAPGSGANNKINAWCGLSIDTRTNTVHSDANGGHDDYWGNEKDRICFDDDVPVWLEMWPSSSSFTTPSDSARYSDGFPASSHTYYSQHFIKARNRSVRVGADATATVGNAKTSFEGYDSTAPQGTNGWDPVGTFPNLPAMTYNATSIAQNTTTEDLYLFLSNNAVYQWTQTTNLWSQINVGYPPVDCTESAVAFDSTRNVVFVLNGANSYCHHTFNPSTGTFTAQTMSGSGNTAMAALAKGIGMVYDRTNDVYLVRGGLAGGATVYSINASTFVVTALTPSGGSSIATTVNISGSPENVYGKFLWVPSLKGSSVSGVIYIPQYTSNAWFLRRG